MTTHPLHYDDNTTFTSESMAMKFKKYQAQQADCTYSLLFIRLHLRLCTDVQDLGLCT